MRKVTVHFDGTGNGRSRRYVVYQTLHALIVTPCNYDRHLHRTRPRSDTDPFRCLLSTPEQMNEQMRTLISG